MYAKIAELIKDFEELSALSNKPNVDESIIREWVNCGNELAWSDTSNLKESIELAEKVLKKAEKINYSQGIAESQRTIAYCSMQLGNIEKAYESTLHANRLFREIENDKGLASSLDSYYHLLVISGNYQEALTQAILCLELNKKIEYIKGIAWSYFNLGEIYFKCGDNNKSTESLVDAIKLFSQLQYPLGIARANSLLGDVLLKLGKTEKAIEGFMNCYKIMKDSDDDKLLAENLNKLGEVYIDLNNKTSMSYFYYSIKKAKSAKLTGHEITASYNLSNLLIKENDLRTASVLLRRALDLSKLDEGKNYRHKIYQQFALLYEKKGEITTSLKWYKLYIQEKEQFQNEEQLTAVKNMQLSSQLELKEKQMEIDHLKNIELENEINKNKNLIDSFFPQNAAEEYIANEKVEAKKHENATILMVNFPDFMKIADNFKAKKVIEELNIIYSKFDDYTNRYGLERIKISGSNYLAVNMHAENEKSGQINAVLTGLKMQRHLKKLFNIKLENKQAIWNFRFAIHTGAFAAGLLTGKKMSFDIWGDSVYISDKIMENGKYSEVTISKELCEIIKPYFIIKKSESINLNNTILESYTVQSIRLEYSLDGDGIRPNKALQRVIENTAL